MNVMAGKPLKTIALIEEFPNDGFHARDAERTLS
jgi:hypothetical protein